ncbi:MAG: UPF0175 family protein [Nanoarchaeota archaeon]
MKKMNNVMTVRLSEDALETIQQISIKMKKDKSTTVRELVEFGKIYFAILQYRENKISLGKAAEIAGMSVSEMIDLLSMLGIENNIELEDYLAGEKLLKDII